jgi:hypothetical protein
MGKMSKTRKRPIGALLTAALILAAAAGIGRAVAQTIVVYSPGEYRPIRLQVTETASQEFTLQTATYRIKYEDGSGTWLTGTGQLDSSIDGAIISSMIDATDWSIGSQYSVWVKWSAETDPSIYIDVVYVSCGERWQ